MGARILPARVSHDGGRAAMIAGDDAMEITLLGQEIYSPPTQSILVVTPFSIAAVNCSFSLAVAVTNTHRCWVPCLFERPDPLASRPNTATCGCVLVGVRRVRCARREGSTVRDRLDRRRRHSHQAASGPALECPSSCSACQ